MTNKIRNDPTAGVASEEVAGEAALIATFYGHRSGGMIHNLHERLYWRLSPEHKPSVPEKWENRENSAEETFGRCFAPPGRAAQDTTAIQLVLNSPGHATEAWEAMRQKLETALKAEDLNGLWGYTLVYQAVLKGGTSAVLDTLLRSARRLSSSENEGLQPLAETDTWGGQVWLLGIPELGDEFKAGTVYCALGPPEQEEALLDTFYGPAAVLLIPDLIAHKGYYQMRQYRGGDPDLERGYEESLRGLRDVGDELRKELTGNQVTVSRLEKLFGTYHQLLPVVSGLKELYFGLLKQEANYGQWRKHVEDNEVVDFHYDQLRMATLELRLMIEPLEYELAMADKAVSVARLQVQKEQESGQKRIENLLVVVGTALALASLVDAETAQVLYDVLSLKPELEQIMVVFLRVTFIGLFLAVLLWRFFFEGRRRR